jgi:exopolysaccharide biosynthesis protein
MKKFISKPYRWAAIYSVILTGAITFTLLDTFVLPKSLADASIVSVPSKTSPAVVTDRSYEDENIKITIDTVRKFNSTIYVADIQISDPSYLKTALANNTYGRNIKETTSDMAKENNAIFAINGDYYGFRDGGYVLRNGIAYRDTARSGDNDALVIDKDGKLSVVSEGDVSLDSLSEKGPWQVLSFGPGLVVDGEIVVNSSSEVAKASSSNSRTAIGKVIPNFTSFNHCRLFLNVHNSGIAALTLASLLKGVFEIAGTNSPHILFYYLAGGCCSIWL